MPEQPPGSGGEVRVTGAHADDQIRVHGDFIGGGAAGNAQTAQIQGVSPLNGALARLSFAKGDAGFLGKLPELPMGLGIADAAAADQHGLFRGTDGSGRFVKGSLGCRAALQPPHPLLQEGHGVVVGLALHVLRHGKADGAGVGGIGQGTECIQAGAHELLGADDPIPVAANRLESIVGGRRHGIDVLHLLQHRVGLAAGIGIAGQHQQRNIIGGCSAAGSNHIGSAGTDGGGGNADLLTLHLLGKGNGSLRHALLVLSLIHFQPVGLLGQCLSQAHHIAVTGDDEHTADEGGHHAVHIDVLIFQKANQSLGHGQTDGLNHFVCSPSILKMCSLASRFQSHSCSGSSIRVFFQGSPSRCRIPQA